MNLEIREDCPKCGKEMSYYHVSSPLGGKSITVYFECKDCNSEYRNHYKVLLDKTEELVI